MDGQADKNRGKLAQIEFLEKLHELNAIQQSISDDSGDVMNSLAQVEEYLLVRLRYIRRVRANIRQKQKHSRKLERECAEVIKRLLDSQEPATI
jgi:hypothetical protein